ncbi:formate--tetrahydrofolate ligase [Candidatus Bipolaricaulota bacterium]|nr:formate--tetrahydrofolate ligase [Candidatus Bipolaricaulota bacterium]
MNIDLSIARSVTPKPIMHIAADLGLRADELWLYGTTKAKVLHSSLAARAQDANGKHIDVTAITPTPLGEGKTTTTIGLLQGLAKRGERGGEGAMDLADAAMDATQSASDFRVLYLLEMSPVKKIETIATRIYGADGSALAPEENEQLERYEALEHGELPICMAKTPLSLSHDAKWKGVPLGYRLPI